MKRFAVLSILLLSLLMTAGCNESSALTTEQLLNQAYTEALNGLWERALELSLAAKKARPDDSSVLVMTAIAQENCDQAQEALETIRMASGDAKSFAVQYTFGRMLFQQGLYEQAMVPLKKAHTLRPDDLNTVLLLEQAAAELNLNDMGQYCMKLAKQFSDTFDVKKNPYVMNELGLYYAVRKNARRAAEAFRRAEAAAPESPEIQLNLARTLDHISKTPQQAKPYYSKYLRLTANRPGLESERLEVSRRLQEIR